MSELRYCYMVVRFYVCPGCSSMLVAQRRQYMGYWDGVLDIYGQMKMNLVEHCVMGRHWLTVTAVMCFSETRTHGHSNAWSSPGSYKVHREWRIKLYAR
jgi:hypothetical protein